LINTRYFWHAGSEQNNLWTTYTATTTVKISDAGERCRRSHKNTQKKFIQELMAEAAALKEV
jgi:hypothetical protein